jgi:hypothetical protein
MTINIASEQVEVTMLPWPCRGEKGEPENHTNTNGVKEDEHHYPWTG